jgi:hypothetical protein
MEWMSAPRIFDAYALYWATELDLSEYTEQV